MTTVLPSLPWMSTKVRPRLFLYLTYYLMSFVLDMLDVPAKTTVCLPYVLVPKMDTSSRSFHKAQNTIAKQAKAPLSKSSEASPTSSVTTSATKTHIAKLFHLDNGMSLFILMLIQVSYSPCLAIPASLIGSVDSDVIKRVRDVLTDITMTEILDEDPQGPAAYRQAIVQQIVMLCTRLRVSLIVVDKLMAVANSLAKEAA